MKKRAIPIVLCCAAVLVPLLYCHLVQGQSAGGDVPPVAGKPTAEKTDTLSTLNTIIQSIESLQEQLRNKERERQAAETQEMKLKIAGEIAQLNERMESLQGDFEKIATSVDLEEFAASPRERFDWRQEIQDLLEPVIRELKSITARPREIEKLRGEVEYYEKQIPIAKSAVDHIQKLSAQSTNPKLKGYLGNLEKVWERKTQQVTNQLAIAHYQSAEKTKENKSFLESIQNILRVFFKSRGRNLTLSLLAFVVVFFLLRFFYRFVYMASSIYQSSRHSFYGRLVDVAYHVLTFIAATGALLLALYFFGDWVLLSLAIIFLFGLAWTAKQALPRFWEQCKLLLNISTVRERERVVYHSLPWKVVSLSYYTQLVNPELKGGMIRLPLRELLTLHSRPYDDDEPWFPCKENDWVILADGTLGKVVAQTPEMVQLVLLGGSRKTYPTEEFLKQNPNNISTNFRLSVTFGIDYRHQTVSTRQIPDTLCKMLLEELTREGYGDDIINLKVEFKQAGASSLDLEVIADFSGRVAKDHQVLSRAIQRIAVESCNRHGWVIPFTQITLHTADSPEEN